MIDLNVFRDGFTAMPLLSTEEVFPAQGAISGMLSPSQIAEHYLHLPFRTGAIAAYCLRRFGYPVIGWDNDKELFAWTITTPMPGVFLVIRPTTVSPFAYLICDDVAQRFHNEMTASYRQAAQACREWAKATYDTVIVNPLTFAGDCSEAELNTEYDRWLKRTYGEMAQQSDTVEALAQTLGVSETAVEERFWSEKEQEAQRLVAEFQIQFPQNPREERDRYEFPYRDLTAFERRCNRVGRWCQQHLSFFIGHQWYRLSRWYEQRQDRAFYRIPFWDALPEISLVRQVNVAIFRTLQDLWRPVPVRDWWVTFDGERNAPDLEWVKCAQDVDGEDTDDLVYDYTAPVAANAGCGVDLATVNNPDWYALRKVLQQRDGTVTAGIQRLAMELSAQVQEAAHENLV